MLSLKWGCLIIHKNPSMVFCLPQNFILFSKVQGLPHPSAFIFKHGWTPWAYRFLPTQRISWFCGPKDHVWLVMNMSKEKVFPHAVSWHQRMPNIVLIKPIWPGITVVFKEKATRNYGLSGIVGIFLFQLGRLFTSLR